MKARALLYARVSTADKGQDYTAQLEELRRVAEQRGWEVVGEFHDVTSGAKASRPGLDAAIARCRAGEVDIFASVSTDRFARSVQNLLELVGELEACGVKLAATREGALDATTPQGKAFLQVRAVFAELERNLTRQRIREGLVIRRARGVKLGRRRRLDYAQITRAREMRAASWGQIASELGGSRGAWSRALSRADAVIDLEAIEYMLAIWYVPIPRGDWMASIFRLRGESTWTLKYRFRYYSGSGDPFDGSDTKNWYGGTSDKPPEELLRDFDRVAGELAKSAGTEVDRVEVRGGRAEFFEKCGSRPWLQMSAVPLE